MSFKGRSLDNLVAKLTEREKEALRLLSRGYDVKSCARELGVSSNTITERLRSARTKMGLTSSREAARRLSEFEPRSESEPHAESTQRAHHIFYGDRFSAVEPTAPRRPIPVLPDEQAQGVRTTSLYGVQEAHASFQMQPEYFAPLANLPLRKPGELGNGLNKKQRVVAIVDLAVKLAMIIAVICLMAMVLNMFAGSR